MRVLFIDQSAELGGAEIMLELMAVGLTARGVDVHAALGTHGPLVDRLGTRGIDVHVLPLGSVADARRTFVPVGSQFLVDSTRIVRSIVSLVKKLQIDLLVTNSQKAHVLGAAAALATRKPLVWRLHDIVTPATFGPLQLRALRLASQIGRPRVLGVSKAVNDAASANLGLTNSTWLWNGVDLQSLTPENAIDLRVHFGWPAQTIIFGTVGRLVRWKGGLEFIEAAALLRRSEPAVRFVIVGDELIDAKTGYRDHLTSAIEELGMSQYIGLLPFTDDVGSVLSELDVLVQPSIEPDPFPTSVVEAAVVGLPVVAFDHGGIREIITHERHGLLVEPGNVPLLADACRRLAGDSALRERLAIALRRDSKRLTADQMCDDLYAEFVSLLACGH